MTLDRSHSDTVVRVADKVRVEGGSYFYVPKYRSFNALPAPEIFFLLLAPRVQPNWIMTLWEQPRKKNWKRVNKTNQKETNKLEKEKKNETTFSICKRKFWTEVSAPVKNRVSIKINADKSKISKRRISLLGIPFALPCYPFDINIRAIWQAEEMTFISQIITSNSNILRRNCLLHLNTMPGTGYFFWTFALTVSNFYVLILLIQEIHYEMSKKGDLYVGTSTYIRINRRKKDIDTRLRVFRIRGVAKPGLGVDVNSEGCGEELSSYIEDITKSYYLIILNCITEMLVFNPVKWVSKWRRKKISVITSTYDSWMKSSRVIQ